MTLLADVNKTIAESGHQFCSVNYIFENMDSKYSTAGKLNLAIHHAAEVQGTELPITCQTGYISTVMVREEAKAKVSTELFQDHEDLVLGENELENTKTGYVHAYQVRTK